MFILNKIGTTTAYKNVLRDGCKIRIVDDKWQLIYKGEINQLDAEILLKHNLGIIPPSI